MFEIYNQNCGLQFSNRWNIVARGANNQSKVLRKKVEFFFVQVRA